MAVPKRKTTPSKRGMRRAHDAIRKINVITDSQSGEHRLSHHVCAKEGTYRDRQVIVKREVEDDEE